MSPAQRFRILIIDDDATVLRAWSRLLGRRYHVSIAEGGEAGLSMLRDPGADFDAIFVDLSMPRVDGIKVYDEICQSQPELAERVVFLTGGARDERLAAFLESSPRPQLMKPASLGEIEAMIGALRAAAEAAAS